MLEVGGGRKFLSRNRLAIWGVGHPVQHITSHISAVRAIIRCAEDCEACIVLSEPEASRHLGKFEHRGRTFPLTVIC